MISKKIFFDKSYILYRVGLFKVSKKVSQCSTTIQQRTAFSKHQSDHLMIFNPKTGGLSWNIMMQARLTEKNGVVRANTAFAHEENDRKYKKRLHNIVLTLAKELRTNKEIRFISLQEGPIGPQLELFKKLMAKLFPPQWSPANNNIFLDHTHWGVITIINRDKLGCTEVRLGDSTTGLPLKDLAARCRTFRISKSNSDTSEFISCLHLPHDNAHQAFKLLFTRFIECTSSNLQNNPNTHHLIGDWNLDQEEMQRIISQVLDSFAYRRNNAFHVNVAIFSSPEGHLKTNGSLLTVDHAIDLTITPAKQYQYTFNETLLIDTSMILLYSLFIAGVGLDLFLRQGERGEDELDEQRAFLRMT